MIVSRRCVVSLGNLIFLAAPATVSLAQTRKPARIVVLSRSPLPEVSAFRDGMRELGWVEGRTYILEERYAGGVAARLHELAVEVVRGRPEIVVAGQGDAAHAVKRLSTTLAIVFATNDPVADGLVASLARPGGNLTGVYIGDADLTGKRVEILHDAFPAMKRLAMLYSTGSSGGTRQFDGARAAAMKLGLEMMGVAVESEATLAPAVEAALRAGAAGVTTTTGPMFRSQASVIMTLAARHQVPVIFDSAEIVDAGGLMSYGPDRRQVARRMAAYVDRILKGAKPGDLPVERLERIEFVINLKTAAALGFTIPPALVALADRVIE